MTRLIRWITTAVREPYAEPEVHFHQGPESMPAVCHDPHCTSPHLDVPAS